MKSPDIRRQQGFSLLEVLVAFSILALTLGVLLRIFGGGARQAALVEEQAQAVILAESMLASVGADIPLEPGERRAEIDERYRWAMRVSPYNFEETPLGVVMSVKPYWVEMTVEWGEGDELHEFTLETLRLVAETGQPPGRSAFPGGGRR